MRRRLAALSVLFGAAAGCTGSAARAPAPPSPATKEPVDPRQILAEWMHRAEKVSACTATYRVTGPIEQTIRIAYVAPDRARFDATGTRDGMRIEETAWTLRDRSFFLSQRGDAWAWAEVPLRSEDVAAEFDAIVAEVNRAFPIPPSGLPPPDYGRGIALDFWCEPDVDHPEHDRLDTLAIRQERRTEVFRWLSRLAAMPQLRDDGVRLVAEDPRSGLVAALSMESGFLESVTAPGGLRVALVEWKPAVDEAAFEIPKSPPGARDLSEEYRGAVAASRDLGIDAVITRQAVTARARDAIGDDDFRTRLAAVFAVAHRTLLRDRLAATRAALQKKSDEATEQYERSYAASTSDRDLRQFCETRITEERTALVDGLRALSDETARFHPPHEPGLDDRTAGLVDEARRRSRTEWFEREITQPVLARFDERVRKVRGEK
jgi:hypothetical protein